MKRSTLQLIVGTLASLGLFGCGADLGEDSEQGQSILLVPEALHGCHGHASSSIPASGNYYLTSFGNSPGDDGRMSCGEYTRHGSWYYAASRQRYGCGSHIKIQARGRCVVAETDDYGPDVCVENAAGKPIVDASPLVAHYLFGASSAGYSDHFPIHVTKVSSSTPLGPCH
jgi:hypothetical protein